MVSAKKVLFLLPYPLRKAPSQRFRVEAFFNELQKAGIYFQTDQFFNEKAWTFLYKEGSILQKCLSVCIGYIKRLYVVLFKAPFYDYIFIHREASPLGPPLFEWLLAKVFRKKILFDFDDAIWLPNTTDTNKLAGSLKCFWKTRYICKWAYKVVAGNDYLAAFARQFNNKVVIVPTCVDTDNRFNKLMDQDTNKIVIGWTGSHSTLSYLDIIYPVIRRLEEEMVIEFLIICNQPPSIKLKSLQFIPWNEVNEIEDLLRINIGLMPLIQDEWSEGKCGFKIIQYLSLGIPALASPVGVNKIIVEEGINGYLCASEEEWYNALSLLIKNTALRKRLGGFGRNKIVKQYSIHANSDRFISLFS